MKSKVPARKSVNAAGREVTARTLELCGGLLEERTGSWEKAAQCFEAEAARCRKRARTSERSKPVDRDLEIEVSKLIQDWYQVPEFVDDQGAPVPLTLWGERESIESLARRRTDSPDKVREWLRLIQRLKAVRKTRGGRFLPLSYTLMVGSSREAMLKHGIKILGAFVAAISHNLSEPDPALREFERGVHSTHVKEQEVPAFRRFLASQGQMFIKTVDAWLTAREDKNVGARSQGGVEVIVEVVSHVSSESPQLGVRSARSGKKVAHKRSRPQRSASSATVDSVP